MSKMRFAYQNKTVNITPEFFSQKVAKAMKEISSSHVYFIMQQAFGEIDWNECEKILEIILKNNQSTAQKMTHKNIK